MSTLALESQKSSFSVWMTTNSPPSWETVGQVKGISGPSGRANVIDVSDLQSTMKEKRIGLADWGNVTLDLFFVPKDATIAYCKAAYIGRTRERFTLTFTDTPATIWEFYGYVSGVNVNISVDAPVTGSVTVEIDGDIDETA